MKVVVIGGTRFIGPHVVRHLAEMGHEVAIFHTGEHEADLPEQVRHVHHAWARIPVMGIPDELKELAPDVVLHMVPIGERDARVVVDGFRGVAGRLVAISSMDVYRLYGKLHRTESGPPEELPLNEDSPLREKLYPYREDSPRAGDDPRKWMDDYEKILAERVVMGKPELPGTVLRLPMVYGPGTLRDFEYVKRIADGRSVIPLEEGVARWRGPRGYVENVAYGVALAVGDSRAAGRIYNIGEEESPSGEEWVRRIGLAAGWGGKVVVVPAERMPEPMRFTGNFEQDWLVDTGRIRREIGYREIISQEEGLRRTVAWQRDNLPSEVDAAQFDYEAEDAMLAGLEQTSG
jgi:nucleoside-diphosphate-sugar epimerase